MATYRRPKGSYSRPTTDFFLSQCMIGGVYYYPTNGSGGTIELYNNATDGSALHVYRIWSANDASGPYFITRQQGSMGGTPVPSYPVVSQGAPQPGLISYADSAAPYTFPPYATAQPAFIATDNEAGTTDEWGADGPICVLMPGDSLRVINNLAGVGSAGFIAATFYWAALRDVG
jgi:hypothetical protein